MKVNVVTMTRQEYDDLMEKARRYEEYVRYELQLGDFFTDSERFILGLPPKTEEGEKDG